MATSNDQNLELPPVDYNSDSEPQTSSNQVEIEETEVPTEGYTSDSDQPQKSDTRRPSNQIPVLPIEVQKELQGRIAQETTSHEPVTVNSNDPNIEPVQSQPTTPQSLVESSTQLIRPTVDRDQLVIASEPEEEIQDQLLNTDDSTEPQTPTAEQPFRVSPDPLALDKLTGDLEQLLNSEIDTNVTLQAGSHTFPAHLLILKARCPELLKTARAVVPLVEPPPAILPSSSSPSSCCGGSKKKTQPAVQRQQQQQPKETQLSYVIELPSPPFTEDLIRGLLRYIYTARIEVLSGFIEELLVVAGDHRLFELKARLENHLLESLNDDNCVKLLVFADQERSQWDCRKLKRRALKYIKDRIRVIIEREEFRNLKRGHCKLLEEVLRAVVFGDDWIQESM